MFDSDRHCLKKTESWRLSGGIDGAAAADDHSPTDRPTPEHCRRPASMLTTVLCVTRPHNSAHALHLYGSFVTDPARGCLLCVRYLSSLTPSECATCAGAAWWRDVRAYIVWRFVFQQLRISRIGIIGWTNQQKHVKKLWWTLVNGFNYFNACEPYCAIVWISTTHKSFWLFYTSEWINLIDQ